MAPWIKAVAGAAIASAAVGYFAPLSALPMSEVRVAGGVVATIGVTSAGFVLAAIAILASVANTRLLRNMTKTGHLANLLQRMIVCVWISGAAAVVGLSVVLWPMNDSRVVYALVFMVLTMAASLSDMTRKFWLVLSRIAPPTERDSDGK